MTAIMPICATTLHDMAGLSTLCMHPYTAWGLKWLASVLGVKDHRLRGSSGAALLKLD